MTAHAFPTRRLRTILDGALILLLVLIVISGHRPIQAKARSQPLGQEVMVVQPTLVNGGNAPGQGPDSANPLPELAPEDATTNAAIIAAENAALFGLQILLNLPIITR